MVKSVELDVFGRRMVVKFVDSHWELYTSSVEGRQRRIDDVIIPDFIEIDELPTYLGDIFHEAATHLHPDVKIIKTN
ncbi:MAG TPA: hypothetical protein VHE99_09020 [Gammaproteobacteria bacterium]|nr:hypothetical protein [Gammaproteobacteria bacterium]